MRTAGCNFRGLEFQASFAVAVGGVRSVALIGHDDCAMAGLGERRDAFVTGLVEGAGWERHDAEERFENFRPRFEIDDPVEFVRTQACCFRQQYPSLTVAALFYRLDDGMLSIIDEQ